MKSLLISMLVAVCFGAAAPSVSQPPDEGRDISENITAGAIKIHHPLFTRVFPGVEFMKQWFEGPSMPGTPPDLIAVYNGKYYFMPVQFNILYAQVADQCTASVVERMEAFIRLQYWNLDPDLEIISHEKLSTEFIDEVTSYRFNHKFSIKFHLESGVVIDELYIKYDRDQIVAEYRKMDKSGRVYNTPYMLFLLNNGDDTQ